MFAGLIPQVRNTHTQGSEYKSTGIWFTSVRYITIQPIYIQQSVTTMRLVLLGDGLLELLLGCTMDEKVSERTVKVMIYDEVRTYPGAWPSPCRRSRDPWSQRDGQRRHRRNQRWKEGTRTGQN